MHFIWKNELMKMEKESVVCVCVFKWFFLKIHYFSFEVHVPIWELKPCAGFIPKSQHYYGNRYALNSRNAIIDFETDQQMHKNKMNELKLTTALQNGKMVPAGNTPKLPVSWFICHTETWIKEFTKCLTCKTNYHLLWRLLQK